MSLNKMSYLGGHWDQCIRLEVEADRGAANDTRNGIEYLFMNSHLKEASIWFDELAMIDPRAYHHNIVRANGSTRPVNRIVQNQFHKIHEEIDLRGEPNNLDLIPDKYLTGTMLDLKKRFEVGTEFDKKLNIKPINIISPSFKSIFSSKKPNYVSSSSLLWMDIFELGLFALNRNYERNTSMSLLSDSYGALLGLIVKASLEVNSMDIGRHSQLNRKLIVDQWYQVQQSEEECLRVPFSNDFSSLARQKFFSADPFAISRIFTVSQVALHEPEHGESIWRQTLRIIEDLPDEEVHLVDFECLLESGANCYQMFSSTMQALRNSLVISEGDNHGQI
ncbi:hypothetical protein VIBNIFTn2_120161 [Vibrio nigripulchritudo FTn2]|uniref:hypothetical protein n=1 Tax=Vibrio nigripulchritudo TaxID=28173 RepID=UPI0003B22F4D|nr:hypothetical protein [Vibrio nigripulchritudo]CCN40179.1 hypothetical protein VIBNIFTn2_120161 [Vibrio nigripulchritudo FTn2]